MGILYFWCRVNANKSALLPPPPPQKKKNRSCPRNSLGASRRQYNEIFKHEKPKKKGNAEWGHEKFWLRRSLTACCCCCCVTVYYIVFYFFNRKTKRQNREKNFKRKKKRIDSLEKTRKKERCCCTHMRREEEEMAGHFPVSWQPNDEKERKRHTHTHVSVPCHLPRCRVQPIRFFSLSLSFRFSFI